MVLGDSTAQGLGAPSPHGGYVGQVLAELRQQSGLPWRVLNLSVSGSLTRDVIRGQLPRLPAQADLVTCGIGVNDILYTAPGKLFGDLRTLVGALPDQTVMLDLPLPAGCWGFLGRASVPYVTRINRTIHAAAATRALPVAKVSAHFTPPWTGKFASDCFHPSQAGLPRLVACPARRARLAAGRHHAPFGLKIFFVLNGRPACGKGGVFASSDVADSGGTCALS